MKSPILRWAAILLGLGLLMFALLYFGLPIAPRDGWGVVFLLCVALPFAIYLLFLSAIAWHEFGHILGAKLRGLTIYSVGLLGQAVYARPPFGKVWLAPGAMGYVVAMKPKMSAKDYVVFIVRGPLFSLIGSLPLLPLQPGNTNKFSSVQAFLGLFGIINALILLMSLIPYREPGKFSPDILQLWDLYKNPKAHLRSIETVANYNLALLEPVEALRGRLAGATEDEITPDLRSIFRTWIAIFDGHDDAATYRELKSEFARAPYAAHNLSASYVLCEIQYCLGSVHGVDDDDREQNYARVKHLLPEDNRNLAEAFRARYEGRTEDMNKFAEVVRANIREANFPVNEAYLRLLNRYIPPVTAEPTDAKLTP